MKMKNKSNFIKYAPVICTSAIIIITVFLFKDLQVEDILKFTPDNLILATLVMMGIYAVKSMSMVFPVSVLLMSSGLIYSYGMAVAVNIIGILICFTIPYIAGKFSGRDILDKFLDKYPKISKIFEKGKKNNVFTAYIIRTAGVPVDVASLVMGASGISYKSFIIGSLMGMVPKIVFYTTIGSTIDGSVTAYNIITAGVLMVIMFFASFAVNRYFNNKNNEKEI
jgi:uncharacterized membrane protein YdjX (TVP38/TMEM64 family)